MFAQLDGARLPQEPRPLRHSHGRVLAGWDLGEEEQNKNGKQTASAAHLYGKPIVAAEAFTSFLHWLDFPATLKPTADRAFCEGFNHFFIFSSATRSEDGLPGTEFCAGTHFNRKVTWWNQARGFSDYITRCSHLLQQGLFVADVLFYNGDACPNFVPPKHVDPRKKIIFQTIRIWLPFCVIFASSLIWRGLLYTPTRKFFQVQGDLFANPMKTVFVWIMDLIPDVSIVLITSWYETFKAEYFYLLRPFNAVLFILMILVVSAGNVYVRKVDSLSQSSKQWATQAILLGLPSVMFGILPFYIASYSIHLTEPPYNSRLAIGMLPGAALISAAILEKIISRQNLRILMMVVVLGMSINWHIRYTNDYRKIWVYQSDFLKQLTWRVPGMEKDTAISLVIYHLLENEVGVILPLLISRST